MLSVRACAKIASGGLREWKTIPGDMTIGISAIRSAPGVPCRLIENYLSTGEKAWTDDRQETCKPFAVPYCQ